MPISVSAIARHLVKTVKERLLVRTAGGGKAPNIPPDAERSIHNIISSDSDPMRMVALTLLAAKARYPRLSAAAIQSGDVDFRSLYSKHLRPALVELIDELAIAYRPSPDAFVSNPYREPFIDQQWVDKRRQPEAADLLALITFVDSYPAEAPAAFVVYIDALLDHMEEGQVAYSIPSRITVGQVADIVEEFLSSSSGGSRMERVMVALLRFVGPSAGWDTVTGHATNDRLPYDAECFRGDELQALAESKDQGIQLAHLRQLVEEMRQADVHRGFVFTRTRHLPEDLTAITSYLRTQHLLGERIEVLDTVATARSWFVLADREDRDLPRFLQMLAEELDERASLEERQDFSRILREL